MSTAVARVVLDTNACLDLFVFGDPQVHALRTALHNGQVIAVADEPCRDEWLRVLGYPKLRLGDADRAAAMQAYDALVRPVATAREAASKQSADRSASIVTPGRTAAHAPGWEATGGHGAPRLPRCRDPDDQKFLELALAIGARWLVSRDAHVLALGRRTWREGWFEIVTPQAWRLE